MYHADQHDILYPLQHGFRKRRFCESQLIDFIDEITSNMSSRKQTYVLVMDFSKAFDKVSHNLLLHKLHHYGIQGKVNSWISALLSNREQSVVIDGEISHPVDVSSGVPPKDPSSPSLFTFYINDIPLNLTSKVRLFADDTVVYLTISSDADAKILQEDLDKLATWETKWKMAFHRGKCQVLSITRNRTKQQHQYIFHGHPHQRPKMG